MSVSRARKAPELARETDARVLLSAPSATDAEKKNNASAKNAITASVGVAVRKRMNRIDASVPVGMWLGVTMRERSRGALTFRTPRSF